MPDLGLNIRKFRMTTHYKSATAGTGKAQTSSDMVQLGVRLGLVLLVIASSVTSQQLEQSLSNGIMGKFESGWPVGDPRRCQELFMLSKLKVKRFEVLPGLGWDNLRNQETGMVVSYNYSQCKVTDDGTHLIPDNVFTIPIKTSSLKTFAEVIKNYRKPTSTTSNTINVEAGMDEKDVAISGTFSHEHRELKSKQIEGKAVTVRVQMRYHRYEVKLQPDATLSPQFKTRLLNIAASVELNRTEEALYQGQLLVRDFGTHVLTRVTAGAGLVKDDYLKRKLVQSQSDEKTSILAPATASFYNAFQMKAPFRHTPSETNMKKYETMMTHSILKTHGGPMSMASNTTLSVWTKEVDANMVAMDRAGDPLYFLVTPKTLQELPPTTVAEVEKVVRKSIELYYEMNVIPGCTTLGDPNFSFSANFDDGSCGSKPTSLTFGVFQTCIVGGKFKEKNPCEGMETPNPKTGGFSCSESYTAVEIRHMKRNGHREEPTICKKCPWGKCFCNKDRIYSEAKHTTYWCAANGPVPYKSGYLFGGLFTSQTENLVTGTQECPPWFYPRKLFTDLFICISDDFELGARYSVPFGGFYSCLDGNPLSQEGERPVGSKSLLKAPAPNSLRAFMAQNGGPQSWPFKCPTGYSQHLATDDLGCAIHYCVQTGALAGPNIRPIKRPPFMPLPVDLIEDPDNLLVFNMKSETWTKKRNLLKQTPPGYSDAGDIVSPGAAAGISVGVALVTGGIVAIQKLRSRRRRPTGGADETREPQSSYGTKDGSESIIITKAD